MKSLVFLISSFLVFHPSFSAQPNFVVFIADDHGQFDSTPYGSKDARTPNIQRLADDGMKFTQAFVASPACAPSRAAFLTGLMPARNGAEANHTYKRDGIASLPESLHALGYETAAFGKVAHGAKDPARHGFDHWDTAQGAEVVEKFLSQRDSSKPLCLFVGTHWPHVPWPEIEGYDPAKVSLPVKSVDTPETRVQWSRYLSAVTQADHDLGAVRELASKRLDVRNTVFIYTADHGAQWPFGKWNLYDTGIRVPFVVSWPGVIKPGSQSGAMIQWIDILPTLIDIAGGTAPDGIDGRSFAGVLRGTVTTHRTEIFTTHSGDGQFNVYPIRALRTGDFKYIRNLLPDKIHTTHIDRGAGSGDGWRYFDEWVARAKLDTAAAGCVNAYHQRPAEELYDLKNDPDESHNLAADPHEAGRVTSMRAKIDEWMKQQGDNGTVFDTPHETGEPYPQRTPAAEGAPKKLKKAKR